MQKSMCTESFMVGLPLLGRGPDHEEERRDQRRELKCEPGLSVSR